MLGYKENELYEKTFYDITYTDDIDISNLHMNKLINGETNVVNFDKRYVHKSGKLIWVNLHSSLIRSEEGKTLYFIVQIQDITKRKSTEEALRKSEDRFRKYFELPLIGIAITKPDRSWLAVNDKMCNILGYSRKELYTKDWMELTPPEDVNEELKRYNEFLTNEEAGGIPFEKRYIRKDEKIIYVQVSTMSVKDDAGIIDYLISVVEDITERKTAQNNLILLTERFLLSKESANIGIWEWNISTNELIWDKEMLKLYDRKQSEFKGSFEDWESSVLNEDVEKTKRLLEECIREVNDFDTEFRIMHKNGAIRYIKAYGKIQKDKNGRPKKMLGVNWDITTLKIVEEQLRIEKERAEELNRLKTNFLANMSHELRTPMVGILGFSEVLGNIITDEQQKDMVDIINKSGKRLLDTLNLILDLSRVESNKQEIDIRETNLTEKAAESVRLFVAAAANKNLYLTLSKPDGDVYALLDERLLNSILENLVNNAIKYTKSGGIEITVCKVKSDGKRWASLSVTDTGIGIPKDSHNLVFEEFRQVSEGFDRAYEGTGLGLTITKKFAELMKGEISLKSELGKGTTFTINFPLVESYSETISEIESIIPESEVSNKIITDNKIPYALLIDDDEIIYKVISKILEGICYVDYAEKADIALEKVKEKKYSLIFLDINLGLGNNGLEVLKEIRNVNGYENVPVSALTAYAMTGDKEKFLNAGCDYYISKPFERKKILDSVKQMLKNKKSN
jgi:PAS domain S-box-containing protein